MRVEFCFSTDHHDWVATANVGPGCPATRWEPGEAPEVEFLYVDEDTTRPNDMHFSWDAFIDEFEISAERIGKLMDQAEEAAMEMDEGPDPDDKGDK